MNEKKPITDGVWVKCWACGQLHNRIPTMNVATEAREKTKAELKAAEQRAAIERDVALLKLAHDHQAQLQTDAQFLLASLGKGLTAYAEHAWIFDPNDMPTADGSGWRRIPKLALLWAQLDAVYHALEWQASTSPLAPLWCIPCDGEYPGAPYLKHECLDHDASPAGAAARLAAVWNVK